MWFKISEFILRQRILLITVILLLTGVMGYYAATNLKMDNKFGILLPKDSPAKQDYIQLKQMFGGNESMMVFSIDNDSLYTLEKFNAWYELGVKLKSYEAIDSVMSEAHMYELEKDTKNKRFFFQKITPYKPESQAQLDSLKGVIRSNPLYDGLLYSKKHQSSIMMVFINEAFMADLKKAKVLLHIQDEIRDFEGLLGHIHISGLPHIRLTVGQKLQSELGLFIVLSILVTSLILFIFFRSLKIVAICNAVVFIGVIWSLGSISFFDFKLSILMVLIPPLIIVISIPNSIFIINKFHQEIKEHGNKIKALSRVIQKIGNATFLTNLTTSLGFATFMFTNSERLSEFGLIAFINIMMVFVLSIIILPSILSYSALPKNKHLDHLEKQWLHTIVEKLEYIAIYKRQFVYGGALLVILISVVGITQITTKGKVTGDLPQEDQIIYDLNYIEERFGGSLPFDILVDTKKKNAYIHRFKEIEDVQNFLALNDNLSKSISVADGIKVINMAYSGNDPDKYSIPSLSKMQRFEEYLKNSTKSDQINPFVDSSGVVTRISMQVKDLGAFEIQDIVDSVKTAVDTLLNPGYKQLYADYENCIEDENFNNDQLQEFYMNHYFVYQNLIGLYAAGDSDKMDEYMFDETLINNHHQEAGFKDSLLKAVEMEHWDTKYTGASVVSSNGTRYMITNLFTSLLIAIVLIGFLMALLFRSFPMVIVSLVPNFIPLLFTGAVMGYAGIPLKPSTILVFSIAFGISVDDTIHFLAKFRQELKSHGHDFRRCILVALRETGISMIYTSIVLFFGFLVFTFSEFGGTKALGILVSLTLLVAMFANLLILPALLFYMEKRMTNKALSEPLFELFDEESDVELKHLEIEEGLQKYAEEDLKHQKDTEE